ncbi:SMI1/KNR4 family protein [Actinokineospora auranticolor]|uniref:SMI1/KNR4 family protein n=1 Tax=Actinokineospora auranticolor TaxID=155976 RepID=UPI0015E2A975|nr:SMI1/KNR4 family protein [Actinokineospora auranticolor]
MELAELEAQIDQAIEAHRRNDPSSDYSLFELTPTTESEIKEIEETLGVELPAKYREFMIRHGGGRFGYLELVPVKSEHVHDDNLLSVNTGEFQIPDFIAVAPVGTGDWWGFPVVAGTCQCHIAFWNHDDGSVQSTSTDFYEFLSKQGTRP